ncbi:MAG TPA: hypothetical protein VL335_00910 [Candidatus Paceibacterota bacterium]|nr:hypothetical protein [Candidatus Paceibacterota bacterium]
MKKILILILVLCGLIILLFAVMIGFGMIGIKPDVKKDATPAKEVPVKQTDPAQIHDATFIIGDQPITLVNGKSDIPAAPGSAVEISTDYFGNEVVHDFNGDGVPDRVFLVAQSTGGTGEFYYVVAIVSSPKGNVGSEGYFLGDRIAPQTTELDGNVIVVNYADRKPTDSFTTPPSIGKTVHLMLDTKTMKFYDQP